MAVITSKQATAVLKDATGTPLQASLLPLAEPISISGWAEGGYEAVQIMSRGTHVELVKGNDIFPTISLTLFHDGDATSGATATVLDMLLKTGTFASGVTQDDGALVWTLDLVLTQVRGGLTNVLTLKNCRFTIDYSEAAEGNKISLSGTAYGTQAVRALVWS